jgi:integrase
MALTELGIKALKPKEKKYRVADSGGLCLEVTPAGGKFWRYRYRFLDKEQTLSIGKYPLVTLSEARRKRDEAKLLLLDGKNPSRQKKIEKIKQAQSHDNTFESCARRWLELKQENLNEKYRVQCLARMEQHVFPEIGNLPIADITIPDVVRVIETIADRGTAETAKRMKQLISQTFRYASQRGLCVHNPASDLRDIIQSEQQKHHPCVPMDQVPELLKSIEGYNGDHVVRCALKFLSLTFVRTSEIIGAQWDEIDFDKQEWHIPAQRMKMKRPHVVPLSRQAVEILQSLKPITGDKTHVFYSSRSKSRHISNGAFLNALKRTGYQGKMTGHGFRTIARTILNEKGFKPDWIEMQLAHSDKDKIRSAYNRAEYLLERKKMMQDYANILDSMRLADNNSVINLNQRQDIEIA